MSSKVSSCAGMPHHLKESLTCPVCKEWLNDPLCLKCGHMICKQCAIHWFDRCPSCPYCRQPHPRRTAHTQHAQVDLMRIVDAAKAYVEAREGQEDTSA